MERGKVDQVETVSQVGEAMTISSFHVFLTLLCVTFQVGISNLPTPKSRVTRAG